MLSTRIGRQQLVQVFSRGLLQKSVQGALDGAQKNHILVVTHLPQLPSIGWSSPEPNQAGIPHRANLDQDFSLLKNYVENQKRQEKLMDWVARKKNSTYIFIAPKYRDCQIL